MRSVSLLLGHDELLLLLLHIPSLFTQHFFLFQSKQLPRSAPPPPPPPPPTPPTPLLRSVRPEYSYVAVQDLLQLYPTQMIPCLRSIILVGPHPPKG